MERSLSKIKKHLFISILTTHKGLISTNTTIGPVITTITSNTSGPPVWMTGSANVSGSYYPINKQICYVLTSNQMGLETFLALGASDEEKQKTDFIFVEKVEDFDKGNGQIKILNDFFMNSNVDKILEFLGRGSMYLYKETGRNKKK